jgi:tRNA pseudouridine38-40 synthase
VRYFAELSYNGTRFVGWQAQQSGGSVQQQIEAALSTIFRQPIEVVGCGRTDTGVHAAHYVLHFDYDGELPTKLLTRINHLCGNDIAFSRVYAVADEAHARFDAVSRSYIYKIIGHKSPFHQETAYHYPFAGRINQAAMQEVAAALLEYNEFAPFCKSNNQSMTMKCSLTRAEWVFDTPGEWAFHITSNRFLRGMIRLIVGASLYIGEGKMSVAQLRQALDTQTALPCPYSVPPQGLFLTNIIY